MNCKHVIVPECEGCSLIDFDIKHKYSKDLTLTINYGIIFLASNVLQSVKMEKDSSSFGTVLNKLPICWC